MNTKYVHGYSRRESERLSDQANILAHLLHESVVFTKNSRVLEAGCGTGSQTIHLIKNNPSCIFTSIDISIESLKEAERKVNNVKFQNISFMQSSIYDLPFKNEEFDHIFVCFVLEHLEEPLRALSRLKRVLKKGGSITVIEGDHGSCYFHPETEASLKAWDCLVKSQENLNGNSLIGRQVYPLLNNSGFKDINVTPVKIYADASRPEMVEGFIKKIIIPMVEGVKNQAIKNNMIDIKTWNQGIRDLYRTAGRDGTFCYTFFKGVGLKK